MTANGEKAYNGKILSVNLSTGEITVEHFDDAFYRTYLGGYGIGVRLALERIPRGADPLGPDNMLGFFPGALTGTPLFGQRFQVVCKSPLTGGWATPTVAATSVPRSSTPAGTASWSSARLLPPS